MKTTYITLLAACLALLGACREEDFLYRGERYVQFGTETSYITRVSFVYQHASITSDTSAIIVHLLGDPANVPLHFDLEQIEHGSWDIKYDDFGNITDSIPIPALQAEAGVHYQPLDKSKMVIPAGGLSASIPVIFLRHPSLMTEDRYLRLRVIPGEGLKIGTRNKLENVIQITDQLVQPDQWAPLDWVMGTYSRVKHRMLIDVSGGLKWDDSTFDNIGWDYYAIQFYIDLCNEVLAAYRQEHGTDMVDENGEVIFFYGFM
ncbi:MAG: DUF4843 domain-containing protein [Odoribacteraceae bacterium]|jgi:hypothetical protein|nr:DUF4843 domain-containing protein [Odoribacteraceae bacterium]